MAVFSYKERCQKAAFCYIETFYNRIRPHPGIGWLAPSVFERMLTEDFGVIELLCRVL